MDFRELCIPNVDVVALRAVFGLSFCKDLVLELILVLLLFKLDMGFLSAAGVNIFKLFLGATAAVVGVVLFSISSAKVNKQIVVKNVNKHFKKCKHKPSLLFFRRLFVRSLILVKALVLLPDRIDPLKS